MAQIFDTIKKAGYSVFTLVHVTKTSITGLVSKRKKVKRIALVAIVATDYHLEVLTVSGSVATSSEFSLDLVNCGPF